MGADDTGHVESLRPLSERSLEELLWEALSRRLEGLVLMRDRDGLRHGVWVQGGFVVGIHVAGRFDPLLDVLRQQGALSPHAYRACVQALWRSGARSGAVAMEVAGVERPLVRDALRTQACARMAALLEVAASRGHDACFEARDVPLAEFSVRMPLGALLRGVGHADSAHAHFEAAPFGNVATPAEGHDSIAGAGDRGAARRQLRALAKQLHPDRHGHLDPESRRSLERALAEATAAYHGLG